MSCPKFIRNYEKNNAWNIRRWSMSRLSHQPSEPAIEDCTILWKGILWVHCIAEQWWTRLWENKLAQGTCIYPKLDAPLLCRLASCKQPCVTALCRVHGICGLFWVILGSHWISFGLDKSACFVFLWISFIAIACAQRQKVPFCTLKATR